MPTIQELQSQAKNLDPKARQKLIQAIQQELAKRGESPEGTTQQRPGFVSGLTGQTQGGGFLSRLGQGVRATVKAIPSVLGVKTGQETDDLGSLRERERVKREVAEEFEEPEKKTQKVSIINPTTGEIETIEAPIGRTFVKPGTGQEERQIRKEIRKQERELGSITTDIQIIEGDIDGLFETFRKIPASLRGPVLGRTLGFGAQAFQTTPALVEYEDSIDFFLSNIARRLGGERGVLTDRDIERVKTIFPSKNDTEEVGQGKINRIKDFIKRRINEHKKRVGVNINRLNQDLKEVDIDEDSQTLEELGLDSERFEIIGVE